MGFLDRLKKTLWDSFFGKPERTSVKSRQGRIRKSLSKKKSKSRKASTTNKKPRAKAITRKKLSSRQITAVSTVKKRLVQPRQKPVKQPRKIVSEASAEKVKRNRNKSRSSNTPQLSKPAPLQGMLIGHVTHFFPQVRAAAIKIEAQNLSVGDEIYFKGVTTNYKIKVDSMQINRVPVTLASKGAEIGILVKKRVREGDQVFKL